MNFKKGDIVNYNNKKAKVVAVSLKGGKTVYKLRVDDGFNTVVRNVSEREIGRYK